MGREPGRRVGGTWWLGFAWRVFAVGEARDGCGARLGLSAGSRREGMLRAVFSRRGCGGCRLASSQAWSSPMLVFSLFYDMTGGWFCGEVITASLGHSSRVGGSIGK
jgi:hypothetical protein